MLESRKLSVFSFFLSFFIIIPLFVFAEEITLTTYYPSPYGSYNELQLYPHTTTTTCNSNARGTLYYDDATNQVMFCKQTAPSTYSWQAVGGGMPSGTIVMWSGSIASIPSGWYLCNGANSTPDLRNRFVIAAGSTYAVGATGDGSIPAHVHSINESKRGGYAGNNEFYTVAIGGGSPTTLDTNSTGSGTANIAVYYALAYIMKS